MKINICEIISSQAGSIKLSCFPDKKGYHFYTFYKEVSEAASKFSEFQKKWIEDAGIDVGRSGQIPPDKVDAFTAAMSEPYSKDVEIKTEPFLTAEEWIETAGKAELNVGFTTMLSEFIVIK
ncbi:MAG: hypothetical protein RRY36_08100 [Bacteroidaceae bacterium]